MELVKKNIHMSRRKGRLASQVHLDEDQIIPDRSADVDKIIWEKNEIHIEEVRPSADHIFIRGVVCYVVLYMDNEKEKKIHSVRGKIPFEDTVHMENLSAKDNLIVDWELLQPMVTIINSRKINYRAVVTLSLTLEEVYDEEVTVDLHEAPEVLKKRKTMSLLQMRVSKKDLLRVRNEWQLPADKPDVREILFYTVTPKGVRIRCLNGGLLVEGTFEVFVLYQGDKNESASWCSYHVPFEEKIECADAAEGMISYIPWELGTNELEVKPDADGELRVLSFEGVLDLSVKLYEEEEVGGIVDAYSTSCQVKPKMKDTPFTRLLVKNEAKCRAVTRMKITDTTARVLQICHSDGKVQIDHIQTIANGLKVEGQLFVSVLYITSDDMQPFRLAQGSMKFSQVIDTPVQDMDNHGGIYLHNVMPSLEQLSVQMLDSEEMEVKALIYLDAIVFDKQTEAVLEAINTEPLCYEELQRMPGMVGYRGRAGEELWDIAKENYTTVEKLMELNGLSEEVLMTPTPLIVVKEIPMGM